MAAHLGIALLQQQLVHHLGVAALRLDDAHAGQQPRGLAAVLDDLRGSGGAGRERVSAVAHTAYTQHA